MFGRQHPPRPTHERIRVPSRSLTSETGEQQQSTHADNAGALNRHGGCQKSKTRPGSDRGDDIIESKAAGFNAQRCSATAIPPAHIFASQATSRHRSFPGRGSQLPSSKSLPQQQYRRTFLSMASTRGGGLPTSSSSSSGTPSLRQYHSPVRKWVWAAFGANMVLAVIFAVLCGSSYKMFRAAVDQLGRGGTAGFPAGSKASDWQRLFAGAAISAAFAVVLTVMFHAWALAMLLCSFKSLADPNRRFGRAFVMSAALCIGLHILNIALQFHGYGPTLSTWHSRYGAPFNVTLLNTCVAFGLLSFLNYTLLGGLLFCWQDPTDVYLLDRRELHPAGVQL